MTVLKIWEGNLPSYWDITTWASLSDHALLVCYRDPATRKRMQEVFDLRHGGSSKEETVYNAIVGTLGGSVYQALITDARAHVQINRLSRYDIISRATKWVAKETFLVEKYKIPHLSVLNEERYLLGNKQINLKNGDIHSSVSIAQQYGWEIGGNLRIEQHGTALLCLNTQQEILWSKKEYLGSWYHGANDHQLYFLLPDGHLAVIDKSSGEELARVYLQDMKTVTKRVGGTFDYKNDRSFDNCTISDVLIHDDLVVWVTEQNQIATCDLKTGRVVIREEDIGEHDVCLSSISGQYVLLYDIKNAGYGSLLLARVEEL